MKSVALLLQSHVHTGGCSVNMYPPYGLCSSVWLVFALSGIFPSNGSYRYSALKLLYSLRLSNSAPQEDFSAMIFCSILASIRSFVSTSADFRSIKTFAVPHAMFRTMSCLGEDSMIPVFQIFRPLAQESIDLQSWAATRHLLDILSHRRRFCTSRIACLKQ